MVVVRRVADSLFSRAPGASRRTFDSRACLSSRQSESVGRSAADVPICWTFLFFFFLPVVYATILFPPLRRVET